MGTSLVLSGSNGDATFTVPSTGYIFSAGQYWEEYNVAGGEYEQQDIPVASRDGQAIKQHGFRTRTISATVVFVAASEQACNDLYNTARGAVEKVPLTVTIPNDRDYPACYITTIAAEGTPRDSGHSTRYLPCNIVLTQKRLA